ncbi:metal ABC transporter substrate-binding protein [Brevibacillus choshinensis]|uniref:Zinc ABC transporter substrate-binding protein n=1 Tax=Brevibacillus choshinensis TaxID=54911 RepID=A0ABX7FQ24_BRECH|nr:metal ABC transporter substrate-binding protein [Brevibacillus choshinensis]QRG67823.1 zinc ABC transporter substrate-binding protein [Brevibacillus choshinensis]
MKKSLLAVISIVTALGLAGCGAKETASTPASGDNATAKPKVYTTIYPLEYVAKRIGGEHVEVTNLVPAGVEPHDFEPTAKDMVALSGADVFAYNGSGLELWIDKAVEGIDKNKTSVVNATEGMDLLHAAPEEEHAHESEAATEEHDHDHGENDPHVWLDPAKLKEQAAKVKDALVKKDQAHAADYEKNFQQLSGDLDQLDKEFKEMVAGSSKKEFMVAHSAFSYLAHRYGLEQVAISGVNPSDEPSPSELKKLVEHVKEHQISYVLFETLVSPKVAEVIAKEAGVQTATLNPLEGLTEDDVKAGRDYLSIMRDNIATLRAALK